MWYNIITKNDIYYIYNNPMDNKGNKECTSRNTLGANEINRKKCQIDVVVDKKIIIIPLVLLYVIILK